MHTFSGPERKGKRRKAWMRQQNPEAVEIAIEGNKEQNFFFSFFFCNFSFSWFGYGTGLGF